MIVCVKDKEEMKCTKTGRPLVWRGNHVYSGDEFTCKICGAVVVYANANPYNLEKAMEVLSSDNPIDMREGDKPKKESV